MLLPSYRVFNKSSYSADTLCCHHYLRMMTTYLFYCSAARHNNSAIFAVIVRACRRMILLITRSNSLFLHFGLFIVDARVFHYVSCTSCYQSYYIFVARLLHDPYSKGHSTSSAYCILSKTFCTDSEITGSCSRLFWNFSCIFHQFRIISIARFITAKNKLTLDWVAGAMQDHFTVVMWF